MKTHSSVETKTKQSRTGNRKLDWRKMLHLLELGLQRVVSYHVVAKSWTWSSGRTVKSLISSLTKGGAIHHLADINPQNTLSKPWLILSQVAKKSLFFHLLIYLLVWMCTYAVCTWVHMCTVHVCVYEYRHAGAMVCLYMSGYLARELQGILLAHHRSAEITNMCNTMSRFTWVLTLRTQDFTLDQSVLSVPSFSQAQESFLNKMELICLSSHSKAYEGLPLGTKGVGSGRF